MAETECEGSDTLLSQSTHVKIRRSTVTAFEEDNDIAEWAVTDGPPPARLCFQSQKVLDDYKIRIDNENWEEGTDTKSKAFTWLRNEKDKMFD